MTTVLVVDDSPLDQKIAGSIVEAEGMAVTYAANGQEALDQMAKEKAKYPPQEEIGFRFVGLRAYDRVNDAWDKSERKWCMSLQPRTDNEGAPSGHHDAQQRHRWQCRRCRMGIRRRRF